MKRAWAAISLAFWIASFLGVWFIARELEARTGERFLFSPGTVGAIVATVVTGSVAIFGFVIINAIEHDGRRGARRP